MGAAIRGGSDELVPARVWVLARNDQLRALLLAALTLEGYDVEAVRSGAALERAASADVAALVLDIDANETSCLDLIAGVRAARDDLAIVVLVDLAALAVGVEAISRGASRYVTKPLLPRELAVALGQVLDERRLRVENEHLRGALQSCAADRFEGLPSLRVLAERYIKHVLAHVGGQKEKAAQILGINRRTLYRKRKANPDLDALFP